ncbi:septal ring lytic transglycosylase RlpA family protein [Roseibium sp.]|uniref:septal ring lytic transglycosylase RlpA family protein n=1 Tax=Roseibium sp. TaxID=1936156 RepID=UPI003B51EC79
MQGIGGQAFRAAGTSIGDTGIDRSKTNRVRSVFRQLRSALLVAAAAGLVAACGSAPQEKAKFSPKKYGVKGSPKMVAAGKPVPKGGGRYVVGKKYKIAGKWYYPKNDPNYKKSGLASWYGPTFHGRKTANGEIFDRYALTAAHTTMPLPSYARVTNLANGRSMIVRVNDRGPFHGNRIIDLSERVATMLDTKSKGVGKVKVEYVGRAPLHGQDEQYLMASYTGPGAVQPGTSRPGTLIAQNAPRLVVGPTTAPAPRPYRPTGSLAALGGQGSTFAAAVDPAIVFEAGSRTVQLAANNRFEPSPPVTAPQPGILGTLPAPAATTLTPGSAISSYTANKRVSDAHAVLAYTVDSGLSLSALARRTAED